MSPFESIAFSTSCRRALASEGFRSGSYWVGACGSPAMSAACGSVNRAAEVEKYVCAAACTPYACWP
jgi:hypothetical protein